MNNGYFVGNLIFFNFGVKMGLFDFIKKDNKDKGDSELKSKEQEDTKEVSANQERIKTKLSKRKKELTEKINSKRFPDMQLLSKIGVAFSNIFNVSKFAVRPSNISLSVGEYFLFFI